MDWEKADVLDPYTKQNWDSDWDSEEDTDSLAEEGGLASILINVSLGNLYALWQRKRKRRKI